MDWKASWIWDRSGSNPRNYWVCFRKTFRTYSKLTKAELNITADSRYIVFVNGTRIGHGPVRSWPFELSYDTYNVDHLINIGENVIAVLVTHYGLSNCQYIEGKGGLLVRLDLYEEDKIKEFVCSDGTWKTNPHGGYSRQAVRIGNCLAWTEIYDAAKFNESWINPGYNDSYWENAQVIGKCGIEPWTKLVPREIPLLTEEPVYPRRVVSLKHVRPVPQHISIDMRPNFFPGEYDVNNKKLFLGYISSILHSPEDMYGYVTLNYDAHSVCSRRFKINSVVYHAENGVRIKVRLNKGKNLLLIDPSGQHHDPSVHLSFDFPQPLVFYAPISGKGYGFDSIGPFSKKTVVDIGFPADVTLTETEEYKTVWNAIDAASLESFRHIAKPVQPEHTCTENVATVCVFKETLNEFDVTNEMHNIVLANPSFTTIAPCPEGDTEIIIDFGRELSGFIEFDAAAPKGAVFDFFLFESMHDGIIEHTFSLNNTLRYRSIEGRQSYRSAVRRGFRYMMLTIRDINEPVKIYSVKTYQSNYPAAEIGSFRCSDYLLNRIWEISRDTTRLCMEDTFVDCPAYEQNFWVGDSRIESLICYYTFGAYDLVRRCLKLVPGSMRRSPLPESHVPSGWQNVLTAWALCWMIACREYFEHTGDLAFVEEIYPCLLKAVDCFKSFINRDGLLEIAAWNMLDWAPMDTVDNGVVTHQNAFLVRALKDIAVLSDVLGRNDDGMRLRNFAQSVRKAVNKHLWDEERHAYIDSIHADGTRSGVLSIQTQLIVYLSDCVEEQHMEIIEKYLINPPTDFVQIASPFVHFFYYESLIKLGRTDIVLDSIRKIWGYMLDKSATTCWEGWKLIEGHYTRSHCHAWSAGPAYFLGAYVLGVRPLKPGFKEVLIQPDLCGLRWAEGTIPIPGGEIHIRLEDADEALNMYFKKPEWVKAQISFREDAGKTVFVNGKEYHNEFNLL